MTFGGMGGMGDLSLVPSSPSSLPPTISATDPPPKCGEVSGLSAGQAKLCLLYEEHLPSIRYGVQAGLAECRSQFLHRRWNCSMAAENAGAPFLGPDLQTSTISVHQIRSHLGGIICRPEQRRYPEAYVLCNEVGKRLGGGGGRTAFNGSPSGWGVTITSGIVNVMLFKNGCFLGGNTFFRRRGCS